MPRELSRRRPPEGPPLVLEDQPAGHVPGRGDDTAGSSQVAVELVVGDGDAEGQEMTPGQVWGGRGRLRRGHDAGGPGHGQWGEDVGAKVRRQRAPADHLDQAGQDRVVGVEVVEGRPRLAHQLGRPEAGHPAGDGDRPRQGHLGEPGVGHPAGLVEQHPHGDPAGSGRVGHGEPRQVSRDGRVEADTAGLDQLQHGQGGERLAERGHQELGVGGDRTAVPGVAIAPQVDHPGVPGEGQGQARDAVGRHPALEEPVDGAGRGPLGLRCARVGRCCRAEHEQRHRKGPHQPLTQHCDISLGCAWPLRRPAGRVPPPRP